MKKLSLHILFSLLLISLSCNTDKQSKHKEHQQEIEQPIGSKRTNTYQIFFVSVNNLRVREDQAKSSNVIDKLKEGTLIYSNGEVSEFTEKVILRGKEYNSPYHKITYNGNKGWTYGGGIYKIYDQGEKDSFTETLGILITQLSNNNKVLLERGKYIMTILEQQRSSSAEWNDIMYLIAEYHLNNLANDEKFYSELEKREWSPEEYESATYQQYDMLSNEFAKKFMNSGMKFTASEGMVGLIVDPNQLKNVIKGPFSTAMEAYIKIKILDSNTRFFSDGGISSSLNDIIDFTISVEKFLQLYPNFSRAEELKENLEYYHSTIIQGSDNSPAYDFFTKELNPEWPIAWDRYIKNIDNGMISDKVKYEIEKIK